MQFTVRRPFRWGGLVRSPGQVLELSVAEASRLRASGVIGGPERAVNPPGERAIPPKSERAVKPPEETRKRKPRAKKTAEEKAETDGADLVADTDSGADD